MFEEGQRPDEFACFSERTVVKLNCGAQATKFSLDTFFLWSLRLSKGGKKKVLKSAKEIHFQNADSLLKLLLLFVFDPVLKITKDPSRASGSALTASEALFMQIK